MTGQTHVQRYEKLRTSELAISFGPTVVKSLHALRKKLEDAPRFSGETLELMDSICGPNAVTVPVAFAAISQIVGEASAYAGQTDDREIRHLVGHLASALSGLDDSSRPITVSKRTAGSSR